MKSLLTTPSNVLPLHLKQTFPPKIWIFTEGESDGIKSRLPFRILFTLLKKMYWRQTCIFFSNMNTFSERILCTPLTAWAELSRQKNSNRTGRILAAKTYPILPKNWNENPYADAKYQYTKEELFCSYYPQSSTQRFLEPNFQHCISVLDHFGQSGQSGQSRQSVFIFAWARSKHVKIRLSVHCIVRTKKLINIKLRTMSIWALNYTFLG